MASISCARNLGRPLAAAALAVLSLLAVAACSEEETDKNKGHGASTAAGGSSTGGDGGSAGQPVTGGAGGTGQGGTAGSGGEPGTGGVGGAGGSGGEPPVCALDGTPTVITTTDPSHAPQLLATDVGYAVVWQEETANGGTVMLATFDSDLVLTSGPTAVPDGAVESGSGHAAWSGTELGLVWIDQRDAQDDLYFARFDSAGVKVGTDLAVAVGEAEVESSPAIDWGYDSWGLVWIRSPDIVQAEVTAAGELDYVDTSWNGGPEWIYDHPGIASMGIDWLIVVGADANGNQSAFYREGSTAPELISLSHRPNARPAMTVFSIESGFAYTTASGALGLGRTDIDSLDFTSSAGNAAPGLGYAWNGTVYGVLTATTGGALELARYGADLTFVDESTLVADDVEGAPGLVWTGTGYVVAYADETTGDIYLSAASCD